MIRKTTVEDEAGRKRLTPAGHVAVALALGSFLVAGASQGFETLARQGEERNKALAAAETARKEEAKEARDFRNEQGTQQSLNLQVLNRAETRAARTEQRLLTLKAAEEQRGRDLALSREVNLGSQRNLASAQQTLGQVDRLINHLDDTAAIDIYWIAPLHGMAPSLAKLAKALPTMDKSKWPAGVDQIEPSGDGYLIHFSDELINSLDPVDKAVVNAFVQAKPLGIYFSSRAPYEITEQEIHDHKLDIEAESKDIRLVGSIDYSTKDDTLKYVTEEDASMKRITDNIITTSELRKSTVLISPLFWSFASQVKDYDKGPFIATPQWIMVHTSGQTSESRLLLRIHNTAVFAGWLGDFKR
jgi:hypothetical protein